jgi:hypothetical protein
VIFKSWLFFAGEAGLLGVCSCFSDTLLAWGPVAAAPLAVQTDRAGSCTDWRQCRELARAAADRGEYETFHDLAWRAVQTGPPKNPELMYLLARAQALSGRVHDALVMLQRLADMGVPSDAVTNDDFSRIRQLPGWTDLAPRLERLNRTDSPGAVTAPATPTSPAPPPPSPPPPVPPASVQVPLPAPAARARKLPAPSVAEALRFSMPPFALGGFAYDVVSGRFLFGDRLGHKLIVVGESSSQAVDLVRAESAGFHEVAAIEIDEKRGDLWVASADAGAGTLHRLQLVSGRPLKAFPVPADREPVRFVDLAVTPAGSVLVLDTAGPQLFVLHPGETSLESSVRIAAVEPASVAAASDERTAYVAHRDGVSRIDLRGRTATRVTAPKRISLKGFERIRWYRSALIAVTRDRDGSRRIVRLDLNASGTAVTQAAPLESSLPAAAETSVTISGDDLLYLVAAPSDSDTSPSSPAEFVAYRLRIRN